MAGVVKHMGTVFSRQPPQAPGRGMSGPRPGASRLHRFAPRAPPCSSTGTTSWPRRRHRRVPTASAGTTGSARSAATSPTPPPSRRRSTDVDAVVYLVHSLDRSDSQRPRPGGRRDRRGCSGRERRTTPRLSLAGWCRRCPRPTCRPTSRRGSRSSASSSARPTARSTLRAGVVIGAGSTSFEMHPADRDVVPRAAGADVDAQQLGAAGGRLRRAARDHRRTGRRRPDRCGGPRAPDVVAYPDLLHVIGGEARARRRVRVPAPVAPTGLVGARCGAGHHGAVQHRHRAHRVAAPRHGLPAGTHVGPALPAVRPRPRGGGAAGTRSRRTSAREGALPSDPDWTRPLPLLDVVPLPAAGKAAARLALHRLRAFLPDA